jgi:hypothetical protein
LLAAYTDCGGVQAVLLGTIKPIERGGKELKGKSRALGRTGCVVGYNKAYRTERKSIERQVQGIG